MSSAQERAAAHVEWTVAEGYSIVLIRGRYRDGEDGVLTAFDVCEPRPLDKETAELAESYQPNSAEDRAALKAELIRRGWVQ
ncbi:hypothetical protein [Kaistia terrae]|uniref:Uncharacterized protein n=1 Tax=Kaistia terrae TaxID=537017 RepID=A0ABW0Q4L7_9HYPH|nr:hypothetical protein [Kaistia terrae]MCX5581509.1 hypothetical protein [Kaistia terrae]